MSEGKAFLIMAILVFTFLSFLVVAAMREDQLRHETIRLAIAAGYAHEEAKKFVNQRAR